MLAKPWLSCVTLDNKTRFALFGLIALAAWYWKIYWVALCIACATIAWSVGWHESNNLWDYLIDPFVAGYALFVIVAQGIKRLLKLRRDKPHAVQK